jgi:peptide deformylase
MVYPIVKFGDPVLEREAAEVTEFDTPDLHKFLDDMFESMYAAKGVGLAAPQIGFSRRIAVIDVSNGERPEDKLVLINPKIVKVDGKQEGEEGCLSIPGFREQVRRGRSVTVRAQNAKGEVFEQTGEDLLARALLHETDHLNGKLYITHISALKRDLMKRKIKKLQRAGDWS